MSDADAAIAQFREYLDTLAELPRYRVGARAAIGAIDARDWKRAIHVCEAIHAEALTDRRGPLWPLIEELLARNSHQTADRSLQCPITPPKP